MKLKDMLELLKDCDFMVLDLDSGLRTEYISSWETDNPQLRTLLDKPVRAVYAQPDPECGQLILEVSEKAPDEGPDKATEGAETRTCDRMCSLRRCARSGRSK